MIDKADTYCGKCIKADVCGMENVYDPATTYCAYRVLDSKNEYEAKVKELEDAISRCEQAEKEFKSRTCKFRSQTNCDFCAFHSDCVEHWKAGEAK